MRVWLMQPEEIVMQIEPEVAATSDIGAKEATLRQQQHAAGGNRSQAKHVGALWCGNQAKDRTRATTAT